MIIATITGGRDHYPDAHELETLRAILIGCKATVVRTGGATGVDAEVFEWAGRKTSITGLRRERWMPDWPIYRGWAGTMRNRAMLTGNTGIGSGLSLVRSQIFTAGQPSVLLVAFSGGVGTMRCCEAARDLDIPIHFIIRRKTA